jgi:hypothetical protein
MRDRNLLKVSAILFVSLFLGIGACNNHKVKSIRIYYVAISTTSFVPVDCDLFEFAFGIIMKEKTITDNATIKRFIPIISSLKPMKDPSFIIDARIKCLIHTSKKTDTICITACDNIVFNGIAMQRNIEFLDLIDSQIDRK